MKLFKSALCLLMAVIMIFSCCSVAIAVKDYDHNPQIYVLGLQSANIYYEDDPEKKPLFTPIDTNRLLGNLKNIGSYVASSVKNREPDILYTCLYSFLYDSFGMLRFNPDGTSVEGVTVEPTVLTYEGDGKYTFYYDSRRNPVDIAPELHDYIRQVKEHSGSDKVELVGSSYGANVVTTYLHEYRDDLDSLDSVLVCVSCTKGISFFGQLMSGEFNVDAKAFADFMDGTVGLEIVADYLRILDKAGVLQPLMNATLVPVLREAIYDALLAFLRDVVATLPAIWTCVDDEYFESSLENMFGKNYNDPNHEYAKLISEAKYYHKNIKTVADKVLVNANEKYEDLNVNVICKYGTPAIPLSKYGNVMADGLSTLEVASFGATCAKVGEQLPKDYKQVKYTEYNFLSPDGCVDASTCALPFTTWYIDGLVHKQKNEDYWKLIDTIVYEDPDVFSNPEIPQFLKVSDEDPERLVPQEPVEDKGETTILHDLIQLIKKIILLPYNLIKKSLAK